MSEILGIILTVDFAFKLVLGNPKFVEITIHFLNAVLRDPYGLPRITKVTFLNTELGKETGKDKLSVLDILAEDELGERINVEVQARLSPALSKRLAYYLCTIYCGQLNQGVDYAALRPSISICVLEHAMFPEGPLHMDFRLRESSGRVFTNDLQLHLIQLPKVSVNRESVAGASPIEQWGFFLANADKMTEEELRSALPAPEFQQAIRILTMIASTPEDYAAYVQRRKMLFTDKMEMQLVRAEARSEGRAEGRSEGRHIGAIQLLRQLLGLPEEDESKLETLGVDELKQIQSELQRKLREREAK